MSTAGLLSLLGWAVLPNLVTGYVQTIFYTITIRAGDPKPAPGSKRWLNDRRRIQIFVILVYLLYTIVDADYQLRKDGNFYQSLGVSYDVDEKGIQSRFRRLTVQFHPDKATGDNKTAIESTYIHLKLARDTLIEPAKRFAYDRFGPEILQWRQCTSIQECVIHGLQRTGVYYLLTGGVLILIGSLGYVQTGKFWRYFTMCAMFVIELYVMTRPTFPAVLTSVLNPILVNTRLRTPYLPFEFLALLRKLSITFFIALSQLGPLLETKGPSADGDSVAPQQLDALEGMVKITDAELSRLTGLELTPFASEDPSMSKLRTSLKEWLVHNTLRNDPEVQAAMAQVLERRRGDVELQARP